MTKAYKAIVMLGIYFQDRWGVVGIVPITSALLRWRPAYLPFGIKTQ